MLPTVTSLGTTTLTRKTFRPYVGELPVDVGEWLVAAQATLNDGSRHFGFLTPAAESDGLATIQPHVFAGGRAHGFWGGIVGVPVQARQEFLDAMAKAETSIFPIEFVVSSSLSRGITSTTISGWPALEQCHSTHPEPASVGCLDSAATMEA
jgi:hypothetical protein